MSRRERRYGKGGRVSRVAGEYGSNHLRHLVVARRCSRTECWHPHTARRTSTPRFGSAPCYLPAAASSTSSPPTRRARQRVLQAVSADSQGIGEDRFDWPARSPAAFADRQHEELAARAAASQLVVASGCMGLHRKGSLDGFKSKADG